MFLEDKDREHYIVVALDTKNQPVSINICHIGSFKCCIVDPREVIKSSILSNADSIIVGHNYPSGIVEPGKKETEVTND
ncbi:JAB domain-containing protein [Bacillus salitolerans]|uniref:JAB domain-containing protein n=1 Tax=Bacillus salitolerans TaxID=1437434 RepID=A0ABW4LJ99_9BACI